ncbi:aminoglycoside 6-adenylyltransferase [Anoxybacteroides rupiense]|jgi:aminoglycoside 6-adenylyltransferase|uniref:aminoglycoside 6-adenylyltransferase n=1 Tax=Anoxybacteroides rupiense TaxID=311460 RepID=UPI001F08965E|nr:aminoglycoside 6-adenylyltransferase [Anoxybacillus rupiensis]
MKKEQELLSRLLHWGEANSEVRAMILTSSRSNPYVKKDIFSDYDVELYVKNLTPFLDSDQWLKSFGDMITCVPLKPSVNQNRITRLVLYEDGTKIDFQLFTVKSLIALVQKPQLPPEYDNGYQILLDKDQLTQKLKTPTYSAFLTQKPTEEEYLELINDFWWDTTYVAKGLWRDELYFAKFMLDSVIRFHYLQKMVEWYIGVQYDWKVNPNKHGRWFKRYLDEETWIELESTFVGSNIEDNWTALFGMADLFTKLSAKVGQSLGYTYPSKVEEKIREYLLQVRRLDRC